VHVSFKEIYKCLNPEDLLAFDTSWPPQIHNVNHSS
jgi:hypothetical protein